MALHGCRFGFVIIFALHGYKPVTSTRPSPLKTCRAGQGLVELD